MRAASVRPAETSRGRSARVIPLSPANGRGHVIVERIEFFMDYLGNKQMTAKRSPQFGPSLGLSA
jgi:hypothetical protein